MWSLDYLSISVQSKGRYKTTPPSPNVVKSFIQIPRQGQATRTKNKKTIIVDKNEILTHEIQPHMKPWVDIIREYSICLGENGKTQNKPKELLPYGMLLTRLFKHVVFVFPELAVDHYISHDRVMHPLAPYYEQKTRSDHGKKISRESNASSSSTTINYPSYYRPLDDTIDENNDESFHSNSSSLSQNVSSLSNVIHRKTYNNDKNLSEIQLEHEKKDEFVTVVVKVVRDYYMMVVKEIVNRLLEEVERSWNGGLSKTLMMKERRMKKVKVVVKYENCMI
nr:cytochrome P450 [Tanacetum cinerariifolium]